MKYYPSALIDKIEKKSENIYPILFYGNEGGLISELIKSIHNSLQKKINIGEIKYFEHKNITYKDFENILKNSSLFSKTQLIVIDNPQERLIQELEKIEEFKNSLIINGENLRSKSKIKSYFDNHKYFFSVPCYQLNQANIKKIIDNFLKNNNITLQNEAYWFLIDNINIDYLVLKNELEKLLVYKDSTATLESLKKLIVRDVNTNSESFFFSCATGNYGSILKEMNSSIQSISESYEVLLSVKKFINILTSAVLNKDNSGLESAVNTFLPKYLFLKKEIFKETVRKTNIQKVGKINKMLQKTEYLLRRNAEQHKEILERLLLNLAKIMK